ncbi:MAG: HEAT repeat domain-containing protein [Candidatus Zixiibacteriota bacterium]|jgi:HEAT repeat protein
MMMRYVFRITLVLGLLSAAAVATAAAEERKPPQDIDYLIDLLKSKDVTERRDTARTLGVMGFDVATPGLIEALDDDDAKVQLLAAEALGKIGDKRAVDPLIAKLPYAESGVKRFILGALGQLGDAQALEPMLDSLANDSEPDVRASAAYGLGELGDAGAVDPLVAALGDDYKWVRYEACGALRKLKAAGARSALERVAEGDPDKQVRSAAKKALDSI